MAIPCSQIITSNDYRDYIVSYSQQLYEERLQNSDVCYRRLNNDWYIIHYPEALSYPLSITQHSYFAIPKLYTTMDTSSMTASGITTIQNQPVLDLRGQGVLIGFVDTGIDYLNEVFQSPPGISKIESIWDQTIPFTGSTNLENQFYNYGTIYTKEDINRALSASRNGGNPYDIVPSRDDVGHGTFLAGIAAGSESDTGDFIGAAPDASVIMVKLKPAKQYLRDFFLIRDNAIAYQETDIMMGIHFLHDEAVRLGRPLVICIGLGTNSGPHNSETALNQYISSISILNNIAVVSCVGNEGNARHHFAGVVVGGSETPVEINVDEGEPGFVAELWGKSPELFSISIVSPTGDVIPRIAITNGTNQVINFVFEKTVVYIDYRVIEILSGDEVIVIRFVEPTPGIWRINVFGIDGLSGIFNLWLPVQAFLTTNVYFLQSSPQTTLTQPSAAAQMISVGAYNHLNNSLYIDSGRGPTSCGRIKPDLVAPGVSVYGPRTGGGFVYQSGTSIAAAHVAGAAALIFAWNNQNYSVSFMNTSAIKSILIRGARRDLNRVYPNNEWGYGALDLYNSFEQMRLR